ncbi:MAG: 16S rRNA (guanine(527)-N(7))-methyltransferase RsmG [Candidatus Acidiferrales bacterium]
MPAPRPIEISDGEICDALAPFAIFPRDDQVAKIREYLALLLKWNRSVSLTSITDPFEIVGRHFGESMFASGLLPVENCRLADVGTGAGFPGLALKIACPSLHVTLIESNKKKCAFLSEVVRTLGFTDVEIRPERFEEIRPETILANLITCRAVGEFKQLLRWSANALVRRGHLLLWVGAEDSTRIARTPGWTWQPAVHIPDSQRRFILIGRPIDDLPPRK